MKCLSCTLLKLSGTPLEVERMKEWPTYRLRLKDFCKAWPGAKVFVNDYSTKGLKPNFSDNPVLYLYDLLMDTIFSQSIIYQKTNETGSLR